MFIDFEPNDYPLVTEEFEVSEQDIVFFVSGWSSLPEFGAHPRPFRRAIDDRLADYARRNGSAFGRRGR